MRRAILVIARLDRLSRNVGFISQLMQSGLEFVATDFPQANRLTIHILAAVAEYESKIISQRTKAALAAAKARGVKHGGFYASCLVNIKAAKAASLIARRDRAIARARDLAPLIWGLVAQGNSRVAIAEELNRQNIETPRKCLWCNSTVLEVVQRTVDEFGHIPDVESALKLGWRYFRSRQRAYELAPIVWALRAKGHSLTAIADELNRRGIASARRRLWHSSAVWKVLKLTQQDFSSVAQEFVLVPSNLYARRLKARIEELAPCDWALRSEGNSFRQIAAKLNRQGLSSPCDHQWNASGVGRVLKLTGHEFPDVAQSFVPKKFDSQSVLARARAKKLAPIVWRLVAEGRSYEAIADELNRLNVPTARNRKWHSSTVGMIIRRTSDGTVRLTKLGVFDGYVGS